MHSELPYYILKLLQQHGRVYLPGLGTLRMQTIPAQVNPDNGTITPPRHTGSFLSGGEGQTVLYDYISYVKGCSTEQASKYVYDFIGKVNAVIREVGTCTVDGLGTFSKSLDNRLTYFLPEAEAFDQAHFGFQTLTLPVVEIPLAPAARIDAPLVQAPAIVTQVTEQQVRKENAETVAAVPQTMQSPLPSTEEELNIDHLPPGKRERSNKWIIPLILLGILILAGTGFLFWKGLNSDRQKQSDADADRMEDSQTREAESEENPFVSPGNQEEPDSEQVSGEMGLTDNTEDDFDAPIEEGEPEAEENYMEEMPEKAPDEQESITEDRTSPVITEERSVEGSAALNDLPEEVKKEDWGCLAVVGAFGKPGNVSRMVSQLREMGYPARIWTEGGLTKVGVPVECLSASGDSTLQSLRSSVEASSWIYVKEGN